VKAEITEPIEITLNGTTRKQPFYVIESPTRLRPDVDGVVSWSALRNDIWVFQGEKHRVLIGVKFPEEARNWLKLPIRPIRGLLWVEVPLSDGKNGEILIDTGSANGVSLGPQVWQRWCKDHPAAPESILAFGTVHDRLVITPECWSDQLDLGPLQLHDVPVSQSSRWENESTRDYFATVGLYAVRSAQRHAACGQLVKERIVRADGKTPPLQVTVALRCEASR
jgi:hypothetical protein